MNQFFENRQGCLVEDIFDPIDLLNRDYLPIMDVRDEDLELLKKNLKNHPMKWNKNKINNIKIVKKKPSTRCLKNTVYYLASFPLIYENGEKIIFFVFSESRSDFIFEAIQYDKLGDKWQFSKLLKHEMGSIVR